MTTTPKKMTASVEDGYLIIRVPLKPLPLHLARHHRKYAGRWAGLMRSEPAILVEVCDHVVTSLNYLMRFAGKVIAWQDAG